MKIQTSPAFELNKTPRKKLRRSTYSQSLRLIFILVDSSNPTQISSYIKTMAKSSNPKTIGTSAASMNQPINPYSGSDPFKAELAAFLHQQTDINVMLHFLGHPIFGAPYSLDEAVIVCLNLEWWQNDPHPTTEIGIAELHPIGQFPNAHAANILSQICVAHARIIEHAHFINQFDGAGNPEDFYFGTTKFVTNLEARQILVNTFCRLRMDKKGQMQPIILLAHDAEGKFEHIKEKMSIDILGLNTVVKVVDTQKLAEQAGIRAPKGPTISLTHLVNHFNLEHFNLHTAGNDAGFTMITAILASLKNDLYGQYLPFTKAFDQPPSIVDGLDIYTVVNDVMAICKVKPPPPWGIRYYCTRCGLYNHLRATCFANVSCTICKYSRNRKLEGNSGTHATAKCVYNYLELPEVNKSPVMVKTLPIPPKDPKGHGYDMGSVAEWVAETQEEAEQIQEE